MDYKNKYLKYKNKYVELKKMSGGVVEMHTPFVLYIIGEETGVISQRSYLCTFLYQIEFIKKHTGITNDRIHLIYGKNGIDTVRNTCSNPKAGAMEDQPIPYGIDVTYIDNTFDSTLLQQTISQILQKKIIPSTPIIFLYDGHGYTDPPNIEGEMVLYEALTITPSMMYSLFKPFDVNKKFLIFTQCGSFGFYSKIIGLKDKLLNVVYLLSTNGLKQCGIGAHVLIKLSSLIDQNSNYKFFKDMGPDLINYKIEDITPIKISDIYVNYKSKSLQNNDRVVLKTDNGKYMSYTFPSTSREPIDVQDKQMTLNWIIEIIGDKIKIKTENKYKSTFTNTFVSDYIDIYGPVINTKVYLWNSLPSSSQQDFIVNNDNTISPQYDPESRLGYDPINNFFIHTKKTLIKPENLVRIVVN